MTSDPQTQQSFKRPPSPIAAGLLGAIFVVACPVFPPHVVGMVLGVLIGAAVAGARAKAGLREAAIIGIVMGCTIAALALIGTGIIAMVAGLVPPSSLQNTPFESLSPVSVIGIGLVAALGYGVVGFGISYLTGTVVRRQHREAAA